MASQKPSKVFYGQVWQIVDSKHESDLMGNLAEFKTSISTLETEVDSLLVPQNDDAGSVFSGFSSDSSDTYSLPSIGKSDGLFSEPMFSVKTILGQLTRISTAIRRSGTKFRYKKADMSLKEEDFEDFKTHLTVIILKSNIQSCTEVPADNDAIRACITDEKRLTVVQKRLINANIVRRNRIKFATRSIKPVEISTAQQVKAIEVPTATAVPTPRLPQKPTKRISDRPDIPPQAFSTIAPSVTQTATEMGFQLNLQHAVKLKKSTPSVVTCVTQTGTNQDYPSCPEPISDELLRCPYCADLLSAIYAKNQSRWRYRTKLQALKDSMAN
jgi:hypothetical protein